MKSVFSEALKQNIKDQNEVIRGIRKTINGLKWKPVAQGQVATLLAAVVAARRDGKQRTTGKAALKPFRRPETGPDRWHLWEEKRLEGDSARYLMLAYGALRGRMYRSIERKVGFDNSPSYQSILIAIQTYGGLAAKSWTHQTVIDWLSGKAPVMTWKMAHPVVKPEAPTPSDEARV